MIFRLSGNKSQSESIAAYGWQVGAALFIIATVRIISGIYRGRKIKTLAGADVRPTSDRLRETLFNILAPSIREARFLDLCAGSGAVGIEALSRGARRVAMIDNSRRALAIIEENLQSLGLSAAVDLIHRDAVSALGQLEGAADQSGEEGKFDIVFFDPPYASDLYRRVMHRLASGSLLAEDAIVIVEHHSKRPPENHYGDLRQYREVRQGESALAFYHRTGGKPDAP